MEAFFERLNQVAEHISQIDLRKIGQQAFGIFSIATIHFAAFVYFATNTIPPFVDVTAFANFIFLVAAVFAMSGLVGKVGAVVISRFIVPYCRPVVVFPRRSKHLKLRKSRREKNGYEPNPRRVHRELFMKKLLAELSGPKLVILRHFLTAMVFLVFYLGLNASAYAIYAFLVYTLVLFVTYGILTALFAGTNALILPQNKSLEPLYKQLWQSVQLFVRLSLKMYQTEFLTLMKKQLIEFLKANFMLLAIIASAILGASRAAHVMDTSIYNVEFVSGGDNRKIDNFIVISTSGRGVLGVDQKIGSFLFVPYDSELVSTFTGLSSNGIYEARLLEFLLDDPWRVGALVPN